MKSSRISRRALKPAAIILSLALVLSSGLFSSCSDEDAVAEKIPVLAYHKLVPAGSEIDNGLCIDEATFEKQMKYLHDKGYKTLTMDEFYSWHAGETDVPKKSVLITFDDGYYSMYYLAYPILKKYDIAATVFTLGKHNDQPTDPFDWNDNVVDHYIGQDKIDEIEKDYPKFDFQSHTYDMHARVDGEKPALAYSYDQIMEDFKKNEPYGYTYLAYPWGTSSDNMVRALKDSGYKMAFAYDPFYYALRSDDTYAVNRIKISGYLSMTAFKKIVRGKKHEYDNPDAPENR